MFTIVNNIIYYYHRKIWNKAQNTQKRKRPVPRGTGRKVRFKQTLYFRNRTGEKKCIARGNGEVGRSAWEGDQGVFLNSNNQELGTCVKKMIDEIGKTKKASST